MNNKTTIITGEKNWIEHTAISQLDALAKLKGAIKVVGLPDLHAGKTPVGLALVTENWIYPHIIGNDIGCGMSLYDCNIERRKMKLDRWTTKLNSIRELSCIETVNPYDEPSPIYDLGTIGSGNHFAEFQFIHEIMDSEQAAALNLTTNSVYMLIHSGSRGYGHSIVSQFPEIGYQGDQAAEYIEKQNDALLWAERNRDVVADKLLSYLGYTPALRKIIDCNHNFLEQRGGVFIHRKGAVSSEIGAVVIAGTRGSLTYIVKPSDNLEKTAFSVSHGAGRKWPRIQCKSRIREKYDRDSIRSNKYNGRVVCHDTNLLYEEAPEAYKNIDTVIRALEQHGLITVVATLKPLLTYKG